MNIYTTTLHTLSFYYPLGNTPAVCLTQDLPPEQEADILLLGCGDARNVLFTCFSDNARKIDVTCCDIEPMIHARNVLLYTLLIDDKLNHNVDSIWNIYYHWKIDERSLKLLGSQADKLLEVSKSIDQWHGSVYGSTIRFCDEKSLSSVRIGWLGFTTQGLSASEKHFRIGQLQAVINRAKDRRKGKGKQGLGYRSSFPTSTNSDPWGDLCNITTQWWGCGEVLSNGSSAVKSTHLNPAILYSPNYHLTMHTGTSPLGGIPLSTAYASVTKESPLDMITKSASFSKNLVDCAKRNFSNWAIAFRRSLNNRSVIRIICEDALAFCLTLRNCQLTGSTSVHLLCNNLTNALLILHHGEYGRNSNAAPTSFNVIDTSNLIDHVGPLDLIVLASSLLKYHVTSCVYTEMFNLHELNVKDRLTNLFGVDVRSMAMLLGLVLPDLFTNATSSVEEYPNVRETLYIGFDGNVSARSRLRWRRSGDFHADYNIPNIQMKAEELAKFLSLVYNAMLKYVDDSIAHRLKTDPKVCRNAEIQNLHHRPYNCASFAIFLSFLKANVASEWNKCIDEMYSTIFLNNLTDPIKIRFTEDLALNMHIFRVDNSLFVTPSLKDIHDPILASVLSNSESPPDQLCVTLRVDRECLRFCANIEASMSIICSFEARNAGRIWIKSFSSLKIVFGKLLKRDRPKGVPPYIEEDSAHLLGKSDMFVSVMVPTSMLISMLLKSKPFVPLVKCGLKHSVLNMITFSQDLGMDLFFASSEITSKDVFISKCMPGMSGLPKLSIVSDETKRPSATSIVKLSDDGFKIKTLVKRITMESEAAKSDLALKSSKVKVEFKSPLTAVVSFAGSHELEIKFPVPVSLSKYKVRVARTSSYVEIETCLLDPLEEDVPSFLFPSFLMKVPCGIVPVPWTLTRVNLDIMPSIDLKDSQKNWLPSYLSQMHSKRETDICRSKSNYDFRTSFKDGIKSIFMKYSGSEGSRKLFFELSDVDSSLKVLIVPSSLRIDLANNTIVLDCALVLLTATAMKTPEVTRFLKELSRIGLCSIEVKNTENLAWNAMMPALVERSRTWKHTLECEYVQTGEVPFLGSLADSKLPICSCGIGKFPEYYLNDQTKKISTLSYVLNNYATRAAVSPIFPVQYVDDCVVSNEVHYFDLTAGMPKPIEICSNNCGSEKSKNTQANDQILRRCSRCKIAKYCSTSCQKANWKEHKQLCKTLSRLMS